MMWSKAFQRKDYGRGVCQHCFELREQASGEQSEMLGTALTLTAEVHVGTGSGGLYFDMPWGDQKYRQRR